MIRAKREVTILLLAGNIEAGALKLGNLYDSIIKDLFSFDGVTLVVADGSYSQLMLTTNSDLDILIVIKDNLTEQKCRNLIQELYQNTGIAIEANFRMADNDTTIAAHLRFISGDLDFFNDHLEKIAIKDTLSPPDSLAQRRIYITKRSYYRQRYTRSNENTDVKYDKGGSKDIARLLSYLHLLKILPLEERFWSLYNRLEIIPNITKAQAQELKKDIGFVLLLKSLVDDIPCTDHAQASYQIWEDRFEDLQKQYPILKSYKFGDIDQALSRVGGIVDTLYELLYQRIADNTEVRMQQFGVLLSETNPDDVKAQIRAGDDVLLAFIDRTNQLYKKYRVPKGQLPTLDRTLELRRHLSSGGMHFTESWLAAFMEKNPQFFMMERLIIEDQKLGGKEVQPTFFIDRESATKLLEHRYSDLAGKALSDLFLDEDLFNSIIRLAGDEYIKKNLLIQIFGRGVEL